MSEFITDINIQNILNYAISMDASDVYIVAGCPITMKVSGEMLKITEQSVMPDVTKQLVNEIYSIYKNENMIKLNETGDADFSFSISHLGRFRCNAYKQRGSYAAVLRVVKFDLPDFSELNIPKKVIELASLKYLQGVEISPILKFLAQSIILKKSTLLQLKTRLNLFTSTIKVL